MATFNYINKDNLLRLTKYLLGFMSIYGVTSFYLVNERESKKFSLIIASIFIVFCILISLPVLKIIMRTFMEKIVVTEDDITYYRNFTRVRLPWKRVQYFIRLPSRGFFSGLVVFYEMGDFKKKIRFESTISKREELISFIQSHVGKLRKVRKIYR